MEGRIGDDGAARAHRLAPGTRFSCGRGIPCQVEGVAADIPVGSGIGLGHRVRNRDRDGVSCIGTSRIGDGPVEFVGTVDQVSNMHMISGRIGKCRRCRT